MEIDKLKLKKIKNKFKLPYNNLFITALLLFIFFLLVELMARIYDLYEHWPLIDIPSHFFAGMAICCFSFWLINLSKIIFKKTTTLVFVFVVASFWEFLEILEEKITPFSVPPHLRDYFFWDGFWDIIVTFFGGLVLITALSLFKKNADIFDE